MRQVMFWIVMVALVGGARAQGFNTLAQRGALTVIIQDKDYVCNYVNWVFPPKTVHRGQELRVECNGGKFLYRIIVTPSKRFIVEPR